jgi:glycosyltransferase involved in cell wall biosynthesis
MPQPEISILLPVRDSANYLEETIQSLEAQTFQNWECLVIEDGSSDNSPNILENWRQRDTRVRVLSGGGRGIVHALNLAFAEARAPIIARMDADDIALPKRLEKQFAFLASNPNVVACGTGALMIDPAGRPICPINASTDHKGIIERLLRGNASAIIHPSLMVQTSALRKVNGYQEEFRHVEDFDLYLRLSDIGQLANVDEILLHYRQHKASANVVQKERQRALRLKALNDYRNSKGDPPAEQLEFGRAHLNTLTDLYADWSLKAALVGNQKVAYHYAMSAIIREFWRPKRWKLLWQSYALSPRTK